MAADEMMKDTALSLQQDLLKMNEQKIDKLIKVVRNRRQVQKKLAFIMKSIKTSKERVKQFQDENNLRLNEIFTILERTDKIARLSQSQQDGQNFLPELMELVGNFSPDVTVETLRLKMATSVEWCEKKLSESMALSSQYDLAETTKIVIQLYDDRGRPIPTCKWTRSPDRSASKTTASLDAASSSSSFLSPH